MITGDFDVLKRWVTFFKELSEDEFREEISSRCAQASLELVQDGFETETDPNNKPWEPKKRPDGFKILEGKTKKLRTKFFITKFDKDGFTIKNPVKYFKYHQRGAVKPGTNWTMPARRMIPLGKKLPLRYSNEFTQIANTMWKLRKSKI